MVAAQKRCSTCRVIRPSSDFTRHPASSDGLQSQCKPCKAAAQRENYRRKQNDPDYRRKQAERVLKQKEKKVERPKQASRRPLTEFATDVGWSLRKDVERFERIFADDRFGTNKQQVAARVRGHLLYAAEVCQDLLSRLDHPTGG